MDRHSVHDRVLARVADIQSCLDALDAAFVSADPIQIEAQSLRFQKSLSESLDVFSEAARAGVAPLSPELRQRLIQVQTRIQGQQAAVHQATGSLGRTLGALFPDQSSDTYGALGQSPAARALNNAYR